jgi:hypothetical protein
MLFEMMTSFVQCFAKRRYIARRHVLKGGDLNGSAVLQSNTKREREANFPLQFLLALLSAYPHQQSRWHLYESENKSDQE